MVTENMLDFTRCQRADGSHYGTAGICRKEREVDVDIDEIIKNLPTKTPMGGRNRGNIYDMGGGVIVKKSHIYEAIVMEDLKGIPGVPRIFGHRVIEGTHNEGATLVMEKAPGYLIRELEETQQTKIWDRMLPLLKQVHDRGWNHGDLHTGNIFYDPKTDRITLIDFGESRFDERFRAIDNIIDLSVYTSKPIKNKIRKAIERHVPDNDYWVERLSQKEQKKILNNVYNDLL